MNSKTFMWEWTQRLLNHLCDAWAKLLVLFYFLIQLNQLFGSPFPYLKAGLICMQSGNRPLSLTRIHSKTSTMGSFVSLRWGIFHFIHIHVVVDLYLLRILYRSVMPTKKQGKLFLKWLGYYTPSPLVPERVITEEGLVLMKPSASWFRVQNNIWNNPHEGKFVVRDDIGYGD